MEGALEEGDEGFVEAGAGVALGEFEGASEHLEGARAFGGALLFPMRGRLAVVIPELKYDFHFRHGTTPPGCAISFRTFGTKGDPLCVRHRRIANYIHASEAQLMQMSRVAFFNRKSANGSKRGHSVGAWNPPN